MARHGVSEAELPVLVVSPTLHLVVVEQCTGVHTARRNRARIASCAKRDANVDQALATPPARLGVAETELAVRVASPALDAIVLEQHAGMIVADAEGNDVVAV